MTEGGINQWQQIWDAVIGLATLATIIATACGILAVYHSTLTTIFTIKSNLAKDLVYRREKAEELRNPSPWRLYRDGLDWGLGKLRLYMGLPWSWQAFAVSLLLSLLYSLLFLLIAWAFFGGPGTVGATTLLPNLPLAWRVLVAIGIVAYTAAVGWVFAKVGDVDALLEKRFVQLMHRIRPGALVRLGSWLYRGVGALLVASIFGAFLFALGENWGTIVAGAVATAVASAIAAAIVGAGAVAVAVATAVVVTGAGVMAVAGAVAVAVSGAGVGAVAGAIAGAAAKAGAGAIAAAVATAVAMAAVIVLVGMLILGTKVDSPAALGFALFLVILPFLNAGWDWLSWWISRVLGARQLDSVRSDAPWWRKLWISAWHMAVDLFAALALLVGLTFTLPLAIDGYSTLAKARGGEAPLALDTFLCDAAQRPWRDGLWAMLMLVSTLVPTALHLAAVLASPVVLLFLPRQRWQDIALKLELENPPSQALHAAARHFAIFRPLVYAVAFVVACLLIYGLVRMFDLAQPVQLLLLTVAMRSTSLARSCLSISLAAYSR